jgi:ribosome-associated protein
MASAENLRDRKLETELQFTASRSSGPGGQHVNKVSTRMELRFDVTASKILMEKEKTLLKDKLKRRISKEGILIIVSQTERSQSDNKSNAIEKFYSLVGKALVPAKRRKPTKPTTSSKARRLQEKLIRSEKKALRKGISDD